MGKVHRNNSTLCLGKVTQPQLYAKGKVSLAIFARGATNKLTPTGGTHTHDPHSTDTICRALCYQSNGTTVYMGAMASDRGDANGYTIRGVPTLSDPAKTRLSNATASDFYDALVSMKFVPPTAMSEGGIWHRRGLMLTASASHQPSRATQRDEAYRWKHMLAKTKG